MPYRVSPTDFGRRRSSVLVDREVNREESLKPYIRAGMRFMRYQTCLLRAHMTTTLKDNSDTRSEAWNSVYEAT